MMWKNSGVWLMGCVLLTTGANASEPLTDTALGESLVRGFFAEPAGASLAAAFQSVHQDGARDREAELVLLQNLQLGAYQLGDFKVTRQADLLIVTYFVSAREMIDDRPTSAAPAYRLTVFSQAGDDWQILAHANLVALEPRR